MMEELKKQLKSKNLLNEEMKNKIKECDKAEEIMELLSNNDVECSLELAQNIYDYYNVSTELSDDELESVSGGCGESFETKGKPCPECESTDTYEYDDGFVIYEFKCNACKYHVMNT